MDSFICFRSALRLNNTDHANGLYMCKNAHLSLKGQRHRRDAISKCQRAVYAYSSRNDKQHTLCSSSFSPYQIHRLKTIAFTGKRIIISTLSFYEASAFSMCTISIKHKDNHYVTLPPKHPIIISLLNKKEGLQSYSRSPIPLGIDQIKLSCFL